MNRPTLEVVDVFHRYGDAFRRRFSTSLTTAQRRAVSAIERCRTAALGGQIEQCDHCGHRRFCYRSCRNRHCPKCQAFARATWVRKRRSELLDCPYFHLVFTLPQPIAALALQNPRVLYTLLFRAASRTLRTLASDPKHLGAEIGFFAVLHSWGQALQLHPHLHCVVPGGGIAPQGDRWISCRPGFFLPVRVLSRLFRRLFLERLQQAFRSGRLQFRHTLAPLNDPDAFARYLQPLRQAEWVVYAKRPFAGPHQVLDYLGRYTHRVAISNHRLLAVDNGQVRFRWRDYRHHRPLDSTAPSPKTTLSVPPGNLRPSPRCRLGCRHVPDPHSVLNPSENASAPVSILQSRPHAPGGPPSRSWAGHAMPIAKAVPAVQSKPFFDHRRGGTLSCSPPDSSPAPLTKKCSSFPDGNSVLFNDVMKA